MSDLKRLVLIMLPKWFALLLLLIIIIYVLR